MLNKARARVRIASPPEADSGPILKGGRTGLKTTTTTSLPSASKTPEEPNPVQVPQAEEEPPPPPIATFSMAKYLTQPVVPEDHLGMTARVAKILGKEIGAGSSLVSDFGGKPIGADSEKWKMERMQMETELRELKKQLHKLRGDHAPFCHEGDEQEILTSDEIRAIPTREPGMNSESTELALLRKENYELRNMTDEERKSKAREIMTKLRTENEALREDNAKLKRQVDALVRSRTTSIDARRPPPEGDIRNLRPFPLSLGHIDRERMYAILDNEWANDYLASRHGGAAPLRNPFDRRRD